MTVHFEAAMSAIDDTAEWLTRQADWLDREIADAEETRASEVTRGAEDDRGDELACLTLFVLERRVTALRDGLRTVAKMLVEPREKRP